MTFILDTRRLIMIQVSCEKKRNNNIYNSCFKVPVGKKDLENLTSQAWKLPPLGPSFHWNF